VSPYVIPYETELAIKYIKQECGEPPRGVEVQVTWEDHELRSDTVISVAWDNYGGHQTDAMPPTWPGWMTCYSTPARA